jgi:hypothetical protein
MSERPPRLRSLLFVCAWLPLAALALWAPLDDNTLLNASDLIVEATLAEFRALKPIQNTPPMRVAILQVVSVYKGDASAQISLIVAAETPLLRSDQITLSIGQTGFWFLERSTQFPELFQFNHPQRFWALSRTSQFHQLLEP